MKSFGKKLREFRYSLKKKHYDTHDSYDARIADRDERVLPDHWKFLIDVWDSEDWQVHLVLAELFNCFFNVFLYVYNNISGICIIAIVIPNVQDKSKIGKASRAKQTTTHCAGSKSFARIAQEEVITFIFLI